MPQVPALGAIVTATAMAIFAGDIPAAMLRMPGTPASAAYTDESYEMSKKGLLDLNLGVNLVFSVVGGLFGVAILIVAAPLLAEVRHQLLLLRVFLAGGARTDLRRVHRHRQPAQGLCLAPHRPRHRLRRHRSRCRLSALHVRIGRAAAGHQLHPGHDRPVRHLRAAARRCHRRPGRAGAGPEGRQHLHRRRGRCGRTTGATSCAAR